ncbi:MAG TPA: hypothetical protein VM512_14250 [Burkholderiaceae bacterium]|jgi:hypothetical protein|nr:hypothetical protein [Burkholderiaceae bacterium]
MISIEASAIDAASAGQIATSPNLVSLMDELGIVWRDQRPEAAAVSRRTRLLSWTGGISIGIGLVLIAIAQYWIHSRWLIYTALGTLSVAFSCLLIFMMNDGRVMLRELRTLDRDFFQSIGEYMQSRYVVCVHLRETYTEDQIRFAHAYLTETLAQLRPRIYTFVGPVEKVGILPLIASMVITFTTTLGGKNLSFYWYIGAALGIWCYFLAFRFLEMTYLLQRAMMLLSGALMGGTTERM